MQFPYHPIRKFLEDSILSSIGKQVQIMIDSQFVSQLKVVKPPKMFSKAIKPLYHLKTRNYATHRHISHTMRTLRLMQRQ